MKLKLMKVVIWRLVSIIITLIILSIILGNPKSATGVTILLHAILTVCHFAFENLWEYIHENHGSS